jgi:hypothetical protein
MFYQNVTHSLSTSNTLVIGALALLPPSLAGYQQSEPANVADVGWGRGFSTHLNSVSTHWTMTKDRLLQQTLQQQTHLPLLQKPLTFDRKVLCGYPNYCLPSYAS